MLILVDMDGVLADHENKLIQRYRERFPDAPYPRLEDRTTWELTDGYPADKHDAVWEIFSGEGFFADLDPMPGAIEAFRDMAADGHDLVICSAPLVRSRWCESEKRHWIEQHLGTGTARDLVLTHDKTLVQGDVLIDDKPAIVGRRIPTWRHVLVDQGYNRDVELPRIARDWSNWRDVLGRI